MNCDLSIEWYPDKVKNNRSEGLVKFIDNITNDLKTHLTKNQNKFWNNLSDEQKKAIVDLANDDSIIIKPADKGGSIVIMNTDDYINACFDTLAIYIHQYHKIFHMPKSLESVTHITKELNLFVYFLRYSQTTIALKCCQTFWGTVDEENFFVLNISQSQSGPLWS